MFPFPGSVGADIQHKAVLRSTFIHGIGIVHIRSDTGKGGMTAAFKKAVSTRSGNMVTVAVSTCSSKDQFNKKIGRELAVERFLRGETIKLPILEKYAPEDISFAVHLAFTSLYNTVT
jgi:hypothetical protein